MAPLESSYKEHDLETLYTQIYSYTNSTNKSTLNFSDSIIENLLHATLENNFLF